MAPWRRICGQLGCTRKLGQVKLLADKGVVGHLRESALWRCFASGAVADGPSESLKAWEKKARKECKGEDPYTKLAHDSQEGPSRQQWRASVPGVWRALHTTSQNAIEHDADPTSNQPTSIPLHKFHELADDTLHQLQESIEEFLEDQDVDDADVEYSTGVLTIKLGNLGTYVINKQTPNQQIWLSSPVSGPARFDWFPETKSWVYKRTKDELLELLENELEQLVHAEIHLR